MDSETRKVLLIMLVILGIVVIAVGVIFNHSVKDAYDWDSMGSKKEEVEQEPEEVTIPYMQSDEDEKKKVDPNAIRTIVLRNNAEKETDSYRFEVFVKDDGELLFNCWYPSEEGTISCVDEPVNASRLDAHSAFKISGKVTLLSLEFLSFDKNS